MPTAASASSWWNRASTAFAFGVAPFATVACGASPIHVDGVVRESTEMRPLRSLPQNAYRDLRVLVRAGAETTGPSGCGVAPLEGSEDHNNAACVPADATNDAVRLVRQRLRSYGIGVARDANEAYDYDVQIVVVGVAPRKPNPTLAKAAARLTFTLKPNLAASGVFRGVDVKAAAVAFESVARDCALKDADFSAFSAVSVQPMTPEFDLSVLASDVVDNAVGCDQLARFFLDAKTRYPSASAIEATPPR